MAFFVADFETTTPKPTLYDGEEGDLAGALSRDYSGHTEEVANEQTVIYENFLDSWEYDNETRVWMFIGMGVAEHPRREDITRGQSVSDFLDWIFYKLDNGDIVFFHNMAFDISFVIPALWEMGFVRDALAPFTDASGKQQRRRNPRPASFSTLCSPEGAFYEIKITAMKGYTITIRDSWKLIPGTLDAIAHDLQTGAEKLKGTIDYSKSRPMGYEATEKEIAYGENDVLVLSEALFKMFEQVPILSSCLTIGGAAMKEFYITLAESAPGMVLDPKARESVKGTNNLISIGKAYFKDLCPDLESEDEAWFRRAYRGGWCINNTDGNILRSVIHTLDVNSLYPSVMFSHSYPVGHPTFRDPSRFWALRNSMEYFVEFRADYKIRPDHHPFLQDRNGRFGQQAHVTECNDGLTRVLSRPDFELFLEQYEDSTMEIIRFATFESTSNIFDAFVTKFYAMKNSNKVNGVVINPVLYLFAKLMLNNLYGKMGQAPNRASGIPVLDSKGALRFTSEASESGGGYIPIGAYITAYARCVTVRGAQAITNHGGVFDYADTDSLHAHGISIEDMKKLLKVGDALGEWDHEYSSDMGRFVRQKTYMERRIDTGEVIIKACGAPDAVKQRLRHRVTEGDVFSLFKVRREDKEMLVYSVAKDDVILTEKRSDEELFERFTYGLKEAGKITRQSITGGTNFRHTTFAIL